jgi:molybdopterin biosynthesis enzyme MoaB
VIELRTGGTGYAALLICALTLLLCAGKKIRDKDVIELRTGGTGYAAHDLCAHIVAMRRQKNKR